MSTTQIADAIRDVTAGVQKAIAEGYRSRQIDADDLVEILLAVADKLDPPVRDTKNPTKGPVKKPRNAAPTDGTPGPKSVSDLFRL